MSDMKKWLNIMESAVAEKKKSPAGGPACWKGKKIHPTKPTKMKGGKRVNNCIDAGTKESFERGQRPAKPWMNNPEMQTFDPNESPEMQSVQLYSIWKVQGEEALVDAMGISYDEFEQGLEALADKWGRSPDEEIVTHWFIEQWTGAEDHMKESFDPGAEPTMAMEFMAIYKEQGEDELSDAMGLTSGEFDREIADLAIATGMDENEDREELIHQYIEDTIANSDMDMHEDYDDDEFDDDWQPEDEFNDDEHDDDGNYRGLYTDGDEDGYDEFGVDAFPDPAFGDGPGTDPDVDGYGDDEDLDDLDDFNISRRDIKKEETEMNSIDELRQLAGLNESYPMGMDPDNNTNVSFNQTKKIGDATLNIHASAKDMAELQKVLQMAGLDPDGAEKHMPEPDSVQVVDVDPMPASPCGGSTDKQTLADMLRAKLQQKLT